MPCAFQCERPGILGARETGCQFDFRDEELHTFDGKSWCLFHLPMKDINDVYSDKNDWTTDNTFFNRMIESASRVARDGRLDLSGVVFPSDVNVSDKQLSSLVFFNCVFYGSVKFNNTRFMDLIFKECRFKKFVHFTNVIIEKDCLFSRSNISSGIILDNCDIGLESDFSHITSDGWTYFVNVRFEKKSNFSHSKLRKAIFQKSEFKAIVRFNETKFVDGADFSHVKFFHEARFRKSEFSGDTHFNEASFGQSAWFDRCQFFEDVNFIGGGQKTVAGPLNNNTFGYLTFENARFFKGVTFDNRTFQFSTNFKNCVFSIAPNFHNCVLHQNTDFGSLSDRQFPDTRSEHAPRAYRTLKLSMENVRAWQEAARFFALELESIRSRKSTPLSVKIISFLYKHVSSYGQRIDLPILWLVCSTLIFFIIYVDVLLFPGVGWMGWKSAATLALRNLIYPISVWQSSPAKEISTVSEEGLFVIRLLSTLQWIISLGLIAMFIFAIRRRFKLD